MTEQKTREERAEEALADEQRRCEREGAFVERLVWLARAAERERLAQAASPQTWTPDREAELRRHTSDGRVAFGADEAEEFFAELDETRAALVSTQQDRDHERFVRVYETKWRVQMATAIRRVLPPSPAHHATSCPAGFDGGDDSNCDCPALLFAALEAP